MPASSGAAGEPQKVPAIPVICDTCRAQGSAGGEGFGAIADILSFEPVPRRTQVNNWTAELQRAFVAALAITGSERRAGRAIGRHEYGAQKLRKARGGKGFDEACEAALQIYRDREMAKLSDQMGELANLSAEQVQKMDGGQGGPADEGDNMAGYSEYQEARARIRDRLLRARRLYLLSICNNLKKKAAWERLVGPVDWAKAAKMEPQDNEPFPVRMIKPDMLLTAEGGCMPDVADNGRDKGQEFLGAMDEIRETGEMDGPKARRFFDEDGEEGSDEDGGDEPEDGGEGDKRED